MKPFALLAMLFSLAVMLLVGGADAAFAQTEACCLPTACADLTPTDCTAQGGTSLGAGSTCAVDSQLCLSSPVACCSIEAQNGCVDAASITECTNTWIGYSLGLGTTCAKDGLQCTNLPTTTLPPTTTTTLPPTEACCTVPLGRDDPAAIALGCIDVSAFDCVSLYAGTPLGPGTNCTIDGQRCLPPSTTTTSTSSTTTSTTTTSSTTTSSTTSTTLATCGDGVITGTEECDDGNAVAGDGCDDNCLVELCWTCVTGSVPPVSTCTPLDGVSCDDGDTCTIGDTCVTGTCTSTDVTLRAACDWIIVAGDPAKRVRAQSREQSQIGGDICADRLIIGELAQTAGDLVATEATFRNGLRISPNASVTGDIVTGGAMVRGRPRGTLLPGLAVDEVAAGVVVVKDASTNYDTTGAHAQVAACSVAQGGVDSGASALEALAQTASLGNVKVSTKTGPLTIGPGSTPGVVAGAVNVIDFDSLTVVTDGVVNLDGGGDPSTVYVLRVLRTVGAKGKKGKLTIKLRSVLNLTNGQLPENVAILVTGKKCHLGLRIAGSGVVICPNGRLKLNALSTWDGALLGGKAKVFVGQDVVLTHQPFLAF